MGDRRRAGPRPAAAPARRGAFGSRRRTGAAVAVLGAVALAGPACPAFGAAGGRGSNEDFVTGPELIMAARRLGVELRENIAGPWYQMELFTKDADGEDKQVGKTSGWAQPNGVCHLETIEVRRFTGYWSARPQNRPSRAKEMTDEQKAEQERKRYADINKVARWFGILLAVSIAVWNRERAPFYCQEAHLLAIRDEDKQHRRLVRYYKSLGFKTLRENEELTFQDAVSWGGEGTLMSVDADDFMRQWTPVVRQLAGITTPTATK